MSPFGTSPLQRIVVSCIVPGILIAFILIFVWTNPNIKYSRHLNAGYRDYEAGEFYSVVSECNEALASRPHNYEALLLRGTAFAKMNLTQKAIADDTEALASARKPLDLGVAYYNRGLSYEKMGEYAKAGADFTNCLKQTPGNYQALFERADCYRVTGNPAGAIADVNFYFQRGHSSYYGYYVRGQAYVQQKRWQASVADFKSELQLKPDDGIGWGALGWSQYMCDDISGAIESDKTAIRFRPGDTYVVFNLALCYAVQNNWQEAQPEYEKALKSAKPSDLKGALDDIHNALKQSSGSSALLNAQQLVASAKI